MDRRKALCPQMGLEFDIEELLNGTGRTELW